MVWSCRLEEAVPGRRFREPAEAMAVAARKGTGVFDGRGGAPRGRRGTTRRDAGWCGLAADLVPLGGTTDKGSRLRGGSHERLGDA
jgi:hypothetical protein